MSLRNISNKARNLHRTENFKAARDKKHVKRSHSFHPAGKHQKTPWRIKDHSDVYITAATLFSVPASKHNGKGKMAIG